MVGLSSSAQSTIIPFTSNTPSKSWQNSFGRSSPTIRSNFCFRSRRSAVTTVGAIKEKPDYFLFADKPRTWFNPLSQMRFPVPIGPTVY